MRQALAGMLWSKQYYAFDANRWLKEHGANPLVPSSRQIRNKEWYHMNNDDIISMPDKWEYPWYAAWDLAFHYHGVVDGGSGFCQATAWADAQGCLSAPERPGAGLRMEFQRRESAGSCLGHIFLYNTEKQNRGNGDVEFLKRMFTKLALNFTWWVNRKDRFGKNVFEGGFLGLDNIGVFDRSAPLPTGGYLEQADGTAWMALFCQNMLEMAVELATIDPGYEELATKFAEHFVWISAAVNRLGRRIVGRGRWILL